MFSTSSGQQPSSPRASGRLGELEVLVLDGQSSGACSAGGRLIELGWARYRAGGTPDRAIAEQARLIGLPEGHALPRRVSMLTGLSHEDLVGASSAEAVWAELGRTVGSMGSPAPTVIHYARFEEPFLRALHQASGAVQPLPFDIVCTHQIARRLLPALPRCTLRALAGFWGLGVSSVRRAGEHVRATAFVYRRLLELLGEQGIETWGELGAWLQQRGTKRGARRVFALCPARRLALPDRPGVYRLLRLGGGVLYVGKARSLRARVNSHFRGWRKASERSLEMLTQVRDVSTTVTETALEAALLEADEIKRCRTPYNVSLRDGAVAPCFSSVRLDEPRSVPDRRHRLGPLRRPEPLVALRTLARALAQPAQVDLAELGSRLLTRSADGTLPPELYRQALALFRARHGRAVETGRWWGLGAALWQARPAAERRREGAAALPGEREPAASLHGTPEALVTVFEGVVCRGAHAQRRAAWLCRLSESTLSWREPTWPRRRSLTIRGAVVTEGRWSATAESLPVGVAHPAGALARQRCFTPAAFDRLQVLTTELKRLSLEAEELWLCCGRGDLLDQRRLANALQWV